MSFKKDITAKSYSPSILRVTISSVLGLLFFLAPLSAGAYEMLLGTGEEGSFSYFSGRMLCRTINKQLPDISCKVRASDDEIDNLTNLQSGSLDLAIVNSNYLDAAINKSGTFQFLDIDYGNLAILTPLYDRPIGIFVNSRAGISTLNDLKGKKINAGAPGSIERRAMELIMKAKGWSVKDFKHFEELPISQGQDTMAFCQGAVQAMIKIGVHPSLTSQRLIQTCDAVLLDINDDDIDKLVNNRAPCWKTEISATSYSKLARTFGTRAILVASNVIDKETGYALTKVLYENKARLQNSHPALSLYTIQEAKKGIEGLQLHPGSEQFFSEN